MHSGLYKLRLRNEAGVFESVSRVHIEGPPGRKQQAAEAKRKEEEEKRRLQEEEERKKEVSSEKISPRMFKNFRELPSNAMEAMTLERKVIVFPVPGRDVANQTLPGRALLKNSLPGTP
jgi:hypothetical protein